MNFQSLKPVAWIMGNWQLALGAAGAAVLALTAAYFLGRNHGYDSAQADKLDAVEAAIVLTEESAAQSALEREQADLLIEDEKDERDDAIKSEADATPSAVRIALNCKRLLQAGADLSQFPACAGYAPTAETAAQR